MITPQNEGKNVVVKKIKVRPNVNIILPLRNIWTEKADIIFSRLYSYFYINMVWMIKLLFVIWKYRTYFWQHIQCILCFVTGMACTVQSYLSEAPGHSSTLLVHLWAPHHLLPSLKQDEGGKLFGQWRRRHLVPTEQSHMRQHVHNYFKFFLTT